MNSMMAMGEPRLNWDVSPKNGLKTFFSRENYKDQSMAPSLKELCILSSRRIGESLNASAGSVENEPTVNSAAQAKEKVKTTVGMVLLPKPRVPYPRFSRFSQREQRNYVDLLVKYAKVPANSKTVGINKNDYLQYLEMKKHVNEEVTEFLKFLQNSAKKCAQDYNMLSDNAHLFTEISYEVNECRKIETRENLDLEFDDDVTELETFGATTTEPSKSPSPASTSTVAPMTETLTAPSTADTSEAPTSPDISAHSRSLSQILMEQLQKEKQLVTGRIDNGPEESKSKDDQRFIPCGEEISNSDKPLVQDSDLKTSDPLQLESSMEIETSNKNDMATEMESVDERVNVLENTDSNSKGKTVTSEAANTEDVVLDSSDTDEDCLIIDMECQNNSNGKTAEVGSNLSSKPASLNSSSGQTSTGNQTNSTCSPEESCVLKKPIKRVYKKFDPVGEILKMQDELLKPISRKIPELPLMHSENSKQPPISEQPSAPSDASSWLKSIWPSAFQKPKGRLPYELQDYVEDTSEYVAPQEGNFVYKLFSLQDLLLLVRCSVQRIETRPRSKKRKKIRRQFPVYVLPKVEYQACYGVEALTESELCRLWTESLLHSNSSFYVVHRSLHK